MTQHPCPGAEQAEAVYQRWSSRHRDGCCEPTCADCQRDQEELDSLAAPCEQRGCAVDKCVLLSS